MALSLILAAVDAADAAYLLGWAVPRERRNRPGVLTVGLLLAVCAIGLVASGWLTPGFIPHRNPDYRDERARSDYPASAFSQLQQSVALCSLNRHKCR